MATGPDASRNVASLSRNSRIPTFFICMISPYCVHMITQERILQQPRTGYVILNDRGMSEESGTVRQVESSAPRLALLVARMARGEQQALASLYDETSA